MEAREANQAMLDLEEQMERARERPSAAAQCLRYSRLFIQFLFSYVGLTAMLIAYLLMGAIVFQGIEKQKEENFRLDAEEQMKAFFNKLFDQSKSLNKTGWTIYALENIGGVRKNLSRGLMYDDWYEVVNPKVKWTFFGSVLFSLTVLSTIGYGHIAPVTWVGQMFCIIYALVGIPLMLLVLTNVGRVLANSARLLYIMYSSRLCQKVRCHTRKRKKGRGRSSRKKRGKRGSQKSTKSLKRSSSRKKTLKKAPTQTIVRVDNDSKSPKTRPVSLDVEIMNSTGSRLPPSYDESNEMEERMSEDRESAISFLTDKSRPTSIARQMSMPSPISEERGETSSTSTGNCPLPRAGIAVIDEANEFDDDCPMTPEGDDSIRYENNNEDKQPSIRTISKDASARRKVEFSANEYSEYGGQFGEEKFPRQRSCIEFGQLDRNNTYSNKVHDKPQCSASEVLQAPGSRPKDELASISQSDTRVRPTPSIHSDSKSVRSGAGSSRSASDCTTRTCDTTKTGGGTYPRKKPKQKWVLMKPPTLRTLHRSKRDLKLIDSTLAIRLANYDKLLGSSREDLSTAIPEFTCCDNNKLLTEIAERGFDQASQPLIEDYDKKRGRRKLELEDDSDYDSDDSSNPSKGEIQVSDIPISPVIIFFFGYITFGAILFSRLEPHWTFFEAFYFCFITLTTIGFGDYVPDHRLHNLIACCLYTMVGMAVTSMCIALMMKKFVTSVKNFAVRIGIMEPEE